MHEDTNDTGPHAATVRLGPQLRRKLEDAAKASFRSLNGEIVCRLTQTFDRQTDEARA
jgi:Arc-like DNA binding domain